MLRMIIGFAFFIFLLGNNSLQVSDITPPNLVSLTFPTTVDVTQVEQFIDITAAMTDDISGLERADVVFKSPSGKQEIRSEPNFLAGTGGCVNKNPNGYCLEGSFRTKIRVPKFVEPGNWKISSFFIRDQALNNSLLDAAALEAKGIPAQIEILSIEDSVPPTIKDIYFSVNPLNVPQTASIFLRLSDNLSGAFLLDDANRVPLSYTPIVGMVSPSGKQTWRFTGLDFTGGGPVDNSFWIGTMLFPRYLENGEWKINFLNIRDNAGNRLFLRAADLEAMGLQRTIIINSNEEDLLPPQLIGFKITPSFINTTEFSQQVTIELITTDDLSDTDALFNKNRVSQISVLIQSPSGKQILLSSTPGVGTNFLDFGPPLNKRYQATAIFPRFSEAGTWKVVLVQIVDKVGNLSSYCGGSVCFPGISIPSLENLGFPNEIIVIQPSLNVDGTIIDPIAGGTVSDSIFGTKAELTVPGNMLGQPTDVAIDVLDSPLDIQKPSGFAAEGTNFVNINLTPEPAFPLSPPGMKLVLPLRNPLTPGIPLTLFRMDPAIGQIVMSLDANDQPIIGTVDPGGLSATFMGIVHLSTVVGLPSGISCPSDIHVAVDQGGCSATVNFSVPAPPAGSPGATVSCSHTPGSVFPVGTTKVTCTAIDRTGTVFDSCDFSVAVNSLMTILTQPVSQTVCAGTPISLSVNASDVTPLSYQWRKNGMNIPNATSSTFDIASSSAVDAGSYDVVINGSCDTVISSKATVSVKTYAVYPTSRSVPFQGESGLINVSASMTCGWQAVSNDDWITITTEASGIGNSEIGYTVSMNNGPARVGSITIGDKTFTISQGQIIYEADVAPRPDGSGTVVVSDWVQVGRFSVGLDVPVEGSEFQRADCAPRTTLGDGKITVADWVQAGRYSVGLDPVTGAGGPTSPSVQLIPAEQQVSMTTDAQERTVRAINAQFMRDRIGTVQIELDALGNENALAFTLSYDPAKATFIDAILETGVNEASLLVNKKEISKGRVAITLAMPVGRTFVAGANKLIRLKFIPMGGEGRSEMEVRFDDSLIERGLANQDAVLLPRPEYRSATISIDGSSPAVVSAVSYKSAIVAADSIATVFGKDLAMQTESAWTVPLPFILSGSNVTVADSEGVVWEAPLFYVSPGQINFLIPKESAAGPARVTVTNVAGQVSTGLVNIVNVAPGLFTTGDGMAAADLIRSDEDRNYLVLYGTGWRNLTDQTKIEILIDGLEARVLYAGPQGEFTGLDQINVLLPPFNAPEVWIEIRINGIPVDTVRFRLN